MIALLLSPVRRFDAGTGWNNSSPARALARMRIAVIGTGNIGSTLGTAFARAGHEVAMGSRHPGDSTPDGPPVVDIASALADADVVLLAIPAKSVGDFLAAHAPDVGGKLLIDATNNVGAASANAAAAIGESVANARYVRAFNTLGWENFARPTFDGVAADLFFSAPEAEREVVEQLISDVGLRPAYLGPDKHDVVDSLLPLWFTLAQLRGHRHLAFRVLED
jgi:8-hydroxy-5-deazaflavin:NADPH oxidoreductase